VALKRDGCGWSNRPTCLAFETGRRGHIMSAKNFFAAVALSASAALCGASAYAADLPVKSSYYKAPPLPVYNWTGFYAGVNVGVVAGGHENSGDFVGGTTNLGFAGGGQVGFNWQFAPQWFAGLEGDVGYLGINRQGFNGEIGFGGKADWYSTVRGRFGYTNGPSLFYATGGAAFVHVRNDVEIPTLAFGSHSETASGWTIGGGIETLLGGNWSTRAEYLYVNAGSQDVFLPTFGPVPFDNRFHVYRLGLNYKFDDHTTPSVPPAHNWNGFYVGANAGVGVSQSTFNAPLAESDFNDHFTIDDIRFSGGVNAGYNWQFNPNWVAGLEGDIGYLPSDSTVLITGTVDVTTKWYSTLRGRIGYSTGPALLYATGGAAFVHVKNSVESNAPSFISVSKSETATGWTVGGGIEAALAQNWTARTEYLYIDAGSQDVVNADAIPDGDNTGRFNNRFHVFRFGLNYQFGTY
jgi:outer membrane immunogenic protein